MLCFVAGFILLKIPTMTASLFSGHTGDTAAEWADWLLLRFLRACRRTGGFE